MQIFFIREGDVDAMEIGAASEVIQDLGALRTDVFLETTKGRSLVRGGGLKRCAQRGVVGAGGRRCGRGLGERPGCSTARTERPTAVRAMGSYGGAPGVLH